jgi:hypothetical protein
MAIRKLIFAPERVTTVRREEDDVLLRITAYLYHDAGYLPRVLSPTQAYRGAPGVDALVRIHKLPARWRADRVAAPRRGLHRAEDRWHPAHA